MVAGSPGLAKLAARGATTFFHGTTALAAESIVSSGLKAVSTNTAPFASGSFFTHEASQAGLVAASHWPAVQEKVTSAGVGVVEMTVPNSVLQQLGAQGLVRSGAVPGIRGFFPSQTVFLPGALDILNQSATFRIVRPSF
jgi:hypothetical protein